jgi:hypothetical protein
MYQPLMKIASYTSRIPNFLKGWTSIAFALFLAFTLCFASIPALAQDRVWQVDSQYSFARVSLGSGEQSQEIDVAPVSGKVLFDSNDPSDPVVDINIKPGIGLAAQYSEITFRSKQSAITRDGNLAVIGDLSLTRVQPGATWNPGEDYSGPEYGAPVVRTETREVTFVFPGASLPADQNGEIRLSASTIIGPEDFPQLLAQLQADSALRAASVENCTVPSTTGEDYSGLICNGTPVATANGCVATLALTLKLTQSAPTPIATSGAEAPAGH